MLCVCVPARSLLLPYCNCSLPSVIYETKRGENCALPFSLRNTHSADNNALLHQIKRVRRTLVLLLFLFFLKYKRNHSGRNSHWSESRWRQQSTSCQLFFAVELHSPADVDPRAEQNILLGSFDDLAMI